MTIFQHSMMCPHSTSRFTLTPPNAPCNIRCIKSQLKNFETVQVQLPNVYKRPTFVALLYPTVKRSEPGAYAECVELADTNQLSLDYNDGTKNIAEPEFQRQLLDQSFVTQHTQRIMLCTPEEIEALSKDSSYHDLNTLPSLNIPYNNRELEVLHSHIPATGAENAVKSVELNEIKHLLRAVDNVISFPNQDVDDQWTSSTCFYNGACTACRRARYRVIIATSRSLSTKKLATFTYQAETVQ